MQSFEDTTSTAGDKQIEEPRSRKHRFSGALVRIVKWSLAGLAIYFSVCVLLLILYNWTYPPTTGVQIQRRIESFFRDAKYQKRYDPLDPSRISPHLGRAVVAAEDTRFYSHSGFDWEAIEEAYEEGGRRGASTVTQQLAKNLFLTTHRSYFRKALEVPLTFLTEILLPKDRILLLYVNVVEWGDGVYGAEAAARAYFGKPAAELSRREAAALAACLPNPRVRKPRVDGWYTHIILRRMVSLGY